MTDPETQPFADKKDPDQMKVVALYITFIASAILVLAPIVVLSSLALLGMIIIMVMIGFIRREAEKDSLLYNHATYLSRTFWMWQLLLAIGLVLGGYYLSRQYNDIQHIMQLIEGLSTAQTDTPEFKTIIGVAIPAFAPGCLYAAYRLLVGLHRAIKGYRIARPKSFF